MGQTLLTDPSFIAIIEVDISLLGLLFQQCQHLCANQPPFIIRPAFHYPPNAFVSALKFFKKRFSLLKWKLSPICSSNNRLA